VSSTICSPKSKFEGSSSAESTPDEDENGEQTKEVPWKPFLTHDAIKLNPHR